MSVIPIVGPKCTLGASYAAPEYDVNMTTEQTDGRTDARQLH